MLITEPYYNTDNKIPKVHKDLIHYYHKDGTLGPRASISIHKNLQDQCWELKNFTNRDATAIKIKSGNSYIILASIYNSYIILASIYNSYIILASIYNSYIILASIYNSYIILASIYNSYIILASIYMENSTNTTDFPPCL